MSKDKIVVTLLSLVIIVSFLIFPTFFEDSNEEPLEVYSFHIKGELTRCYPAPVFAEDYIDCNSVTSPIIEILHVFLNIEPGKVMITSRLQINDTELNWFISVTGVIANTSIGIIRDQGLDRVVFFPPKTIMVVAHFAFLTGSYIYLGEYS